MKLQSIKGNRTIHNWISYSQVSHCCFLMTGGNVTFHNKKAVARFYEDGNKSHMRSTNWSKRYAMQSM